MKRLLVLAWIGLFVLCICACGTSAVKNTSAEKTSDIVESESAGESAAIISESESEPTETTTEQNLAKETASEISAEDEPIAMVSETESEAEETSTEENAAEEIVEISAAEEAVETSPEADPSTIIPENPDYDGIYGAIYEEVRTSENLSDYVKVYFVDSNDDGIMEMWIETGDIEETDVYTIRESGAVLIDSFAGGIPYEDTVRFASMEYRMGDGLFQTPWPGWNEIMETWIGA